MNKLQDIEKELNEFNNNLEVNKKNCNINAEDFTNNLNCISNIIKISYEIQLKYAKIGDMKNELIKFDDEKQIEEILSDDDKDKNIKSKKNKKNIKDIFEEENEDNNDSDNEDEEEVKPKRRNNKKTTTPKRNIRNKKIKEESEDNITSEDNNSSSD